MSGRGGAERTLRRIWRIGRKALPPPIVRAVTESRLPRATVPAFSTANPARFAACELLGGRRLRRHELRGGWSFCLHHGTGDASVVAEVFRKQYYRLPAAMEAELAGLARPVRVVDLGAHVGLFGIWIAQRFPTAEIVSFEPDPENFRALECTIAANRSRTSSWETIQACAAPADGSVLFATGMSSSSRVLEPGAPSGYVAEARDVFACLDRVDVLKIDIEGSEWAILGDARFGGLSPAILFLEYHRHLCPADDPRGHATELLRTAGYETSEVFVAPDAGLLAAVPRRQ